MSQKNYTHKNDENRRTTPQENPTLDRSLFILEKIELEPRFKTSEEILELLRENGDSVTLKTTQRILHYYGARFEGNLKCRDRVGGQGRPAKEWAWSKKEGAPRFGMIEPPQALTLQLATEMLSPILPSPFLEDIERDLKRARKVVGQIGRHTNKIPQKIKILPRGQARLPATVDPEILYTVFNATLQEKRILVSYTSGAGEQQKIAQHELSPLGLIFRFDTLYLAHVREPKSDKQDPDVIMDWPLHRFNSVMPLDTKIRSPKCFDLTQHCETPSFTQNIFLKEVNEIGPKFEIKLLFNEITARYVMERPFSDDQKYKTQNDGRVLVTATVNNTRELLSELFSFEGDVEVVAPKALRNYFRDVFEQLSSRYRS